MVDQAKISQIIHGAATAAGAIGAGMSQVPGSDCVPLLGVQSAMVVGIGAEHGAVITQQTAATIISGFVALKAGRFISQWLIGWVPGAGNATNAATAAGITEAIGWAANKYFQRV